MFNYSICILFSGKAGVGKTTSARMTEEILQHKEFDFDKITIRSFATAIKTVCTEYLGWNGVKDDPGRQLLIDIGQDARKYNKDVWVATTFNRFIRTDPNYPFQFVIIDDWRFPNEYNFISKDPLYKVFKVRIEAPMRELLKGKSAYNDVSETSLPDGILYPNMYDYIIQNYRGFDELNYNLENIVEDILSKVPKWEKEVI